MKTAALIILLAVVAVAAVYFAFLMPPPVLSEEGAKSFFLEDLKEKYPAADVREIMEILPATASDGSPYYQLKARVTNGMNTPCPERMHVFYDYPPKNFVAQQPEYITRGCKVCIDSPHCILAFPEEAIIASHTYNGTDEVAAFVKGNSDARAEALFLDAYDGTVGAWKVTWSSATNPVSYEVVLSKAQNSVLSVKRV
ncbi:MAG: hypothetical protein NTX79_01140 [Candidatus Micrarchaeota archaeon]|nr:hypothetical protein [Candidatus Micrarchaeota archaeon]